MDFKLMVGRTVERQIGRAMGDLYPVIPLGDLPAVNGQGPRTSGNNGGGVVLPDFSVAARTYGFVDVKLKSGPNHFNNWNRDEHGIDRALFDAYRVIEAHWKQRVALVIAEYYSKVLLAATLDDLQSFGSPREGSWPNNGQPSINWDRRAFQDVGRFEIPNDDLAEMQVYMSGKPMRFLLRQLSLPFEEAITC